ncbi:DUF2161 domain-containing phosphodiesterase [Cohnella cellulosilytica]|uniref:DUF2161 domain-containing phosphodiesterase n=1 Tax=Cohnella cellulosilytica TaxID=986710 RepID=A0ABW2FA26_9BACL
MAVKLETELYPPVKSFFASRGYEVKAEIRGCDLVAYRPEDEGEPVATIVEMKKTFTLPLLLQGIDRQKTGAAVWLAVERNRVKKGAHNQRFNEITQLCRRLNLGFMTVTFYRTKSPVVDVWCEPAEIRSFSPSPVSASFSLATGAAGAAETTEAYGLPTGRRNKVKAGKLLKEFNARSGDYNVGGSTKRKLVTAYRERAIQCALALICHGPSAPRQIRDWTNCPNAGAMLRENYYGWFRRISKGVYELTPTGEAALREYEHVVRVWARQYPWANDYAGSSPEAHPEGKELPADERRAVSD